MQSLSNVFAESNRLRDEEDSPSGRQKIIKFSNVSKKFVLHHQRPRSFQEAMVSLFGRRDISHRPDDVPRNETFWALRNVNFGIREGEAIGIIGANGSGKSTTLKLISRILYPTSGVVSVRGRISALLELGAGFHSDLTGRENIYLNGSLLGFSRKQMDGKYGQIVEFSELERFIDTPVKHYSSGMYMRLGFAVAISMEPDILITDEVLAVGDEDFQRKCLSKISEFKRAGKTIIFVSHALEAVRGLCSRALWLEEGRLKADGPAGEVVDRYLAYSNEKQRARLAREASAAHATIPTPAAPESAKNRVPIESQNVGAQLVAPSAEQVEDRRLGPPPVGSANRWGTQEAQISGVYFLDPDGKQTNLFVTGDRFIMRIAYTAPERVAQPTFGLAIYRQGVIQVNGPNNKFARRPIPFIEGNGYVDYIVPKLPLLEGNYDVSATIYDQALITCFDFHDHWYHIEVQPRLGGERYGIVELESDWTHCAEQYNADGSKAALPVAVGTEDEEISDEQLATVTAALAGEELTAAAEAKAQLDLAREREQEAATRPHAGIGL
jgi:ABC-type polysaccharide/polyol phosphate transport system ATPase subunit